MARGQDQARLKQTSIKKAERAVMSISPMNGAEESGGQLGHLGDRPGLSWAQIA